MLLDDVNDDESKKEVYATPRRRWWLLKAFLCLSNLFSIFVFFSFLFSVFFFGVRAKKIEKI